MAFRELGHNAYSCDIQEPSGNHPEWHICGDVLQVLNPTEKCTPDGQVFKNIEFYTMDGTPHCVGRWDLVMAHPPCVFLCLAANKLYNVEKYGDYARDRLKKREEAIKFFMEFTKVDCDHVAIENPIGVIGPLYRPADQVIQPYEFGHPVRKSTCLWLKGLPKLKPTNIVDFECIHSNGKSGGYSGPSWVVKDENGKVLSYRDPRVSKERSKTYPGIAKAIAEQWSKYLEEDIHKITETGSRRLF